MVLAAFNVIKSNKKVITHLQRVQGRFDQYQVRYRVLLQQTLKVTSHKLQVTVNVKRSEVVIARLYV